MGHDLKPRIVVLDSDPAAGSGLAPTPARGELDLSPFAELGELEVYENTPEAAVVERAQGAEIVLTNKVPLREATLAQLPRLRLIGVLATGTNVIDVPAARRRGVTVCNVPGYSTASTAQHAFALLLELCHHVGEHSRDVRAGNWSRSPSFAYWKEPLVELDGLTLGVVGFGAIGQRMARLGEAFGMRVQIHSRTARPDSGYPFVSKVELLEASDVVSLHCPLTPETHHFIDADALARLRPSAFVINVARGPIVDERAVADALHAGRLAGFATDVLSEEPPPPDHPLLSAPRALITPHIAWATRAARERLLEEARRNVASFLEGEPRNVVEA